MRKLFNTSFFCVFLHEVYSIKHKNICIQLYKYSIECEKKEFEGEMELHKQKKKNERKGKKNCFLNNINYSFISDMEPFSYT